MGRDVGLLLLRLGAGGMMLGHGWGKVSDLLAHKSDFPDPLGIGPHYSLLLAAFAEFLCALAVLLGFRVRWSALPPLITMLVAVLLFHSADPWDRKELPLLYATAFLTLAFTGGGRYTVDTLLRKSMRGKGGR